MGSGKSPLSGGGGGQSGSQKPKSQRELQIDNLEQSIWRGSGKALSPSAVNVGDRIEGIQYSFEPNVLAPTQKKGSWSGDYNGTPMKFSADNYFQVTSVVSSGNFTTITASKVGGAGGTVKKKLPNDVYLRVYQNK